MFVAGGGFKGGIAYTAAPTSSASRRSRTGSPYHDLHATLLNQLGMDHTKLTYRYAVAIPSHRRPRRNRERHPCLGLSSHARSPCSAWLWSLAQDDAKSRKTVRDAVYTSAQAERGKQVYEANCVDAATSKISRARQIPTAGARARRSSAPASFRISASRRRARSSTR